MGQALSLNKYVKLLMTPAYLKGKMGQQFYKAVEIKPPASFRNVAARSAITVNMRAKMLFDRH